MDDIHPGTSHLPTDMSMPVLYIYTLKCPGRAHGVRMHATCAAGMLGINSALVNIEKFD